METWAGPHLEKREIWDTQSVPSAGDWKRRSNRLRTSADRLARGRAGPHLERPEMGGTQIVLSRRSKTGGGYPGLYRPKDREIVLNCGSEARDGAPEISAGVG